tara:strand:+ start:396 stop:662 length:267 start_codon:yes stop_codon:yes gene_type:complete
MDQAQQVNESFNATQRKEHDMTTVETARKNLKRAREEWNFTGEQRKAAKARLDSAKEAYREASDTERAREECYAELARHGLNKFGGSL